MNKNHLNLNTGTGSQLVWCQECDDGKGWCDFEVRKGKNLI